MPRLLLHSFLILALYFAGFDSLAQTPTPQQIEQFKRLPRAQQEQLARQLGIDLSQLQQSAVQQGTPNDSLAEDAVYPRGTRFDEFGNPIYDMRETTEPEEGEEELKLYGIELFANGPASIVSAQNVPVPSSYLLGAGDQLNIQIYGKENQDYLLEVTREGSVTIPKLGPFSIASMTFFEAKQFLTEKIKQQLIGVEVSVTMGELRTMRIFVMGEAYKPGAYNVSSLSTITNALFASGGVTDIASLRNIQLKRAGELVVKLDLYDLLNQGDSRNDAQLQDGDVVFVPAVEKTVTVEGMVRRPAIYEIKNERTLVEVVKLAGGKLPEGYGQAIGIKRFEKGAQRQLTVALDSAENAVMSGDVITVPKISEYVADSVALIGAVARPGKYQWFEGMQISNLLRNLDQDLLENADRSYVLVLRDKNANRDITVLQADLRDTDSTANLLLQRNDRVLVFSRIEQELLGESQLEDLIYTTEELEEQEKEAWKRRIEEKLFWASLGLSSQEADDVYRDDEENLMPQTIVELTAEEKERVLSYKDATYFSRKRLLAPVVKKLQEQARFGAPLQLVEIAGEVKVPGLYPMSQNADIKDLIIAAGGLTESSYPHKSEVTRTRIDQEGNARVNHISFSPLEVMSDEGERIALRSKDRINVYSIPSWQEELKVGIRGEVAFPGEYTIRRGETLSDLLKRAGGLTEFGDPDGAIFTRESLKEKEQANLRKLAEDMRKHIASESLRKTSGAGSIVAYDEAKKLLRDLTRARAIGRLVIDLSMQLNAQESAVTLEDGDVLYVPSKSQSVNVIGEVYVPTSHLYDAELDHKDYISRSGGYRALADKGSTYIIRANGSVHIPGQAGNFWFSEGATNSAIKAGDTIVVPFDADNIDNLTLWANATQIIYQLAVAVAAIGSL